MHITVIRIRKLRTPKTWWYAIGVLAKHDEPGKPDQSGCKVAPALTVEYVRDSGLVSKIGDAIATVAAETGKHGLA